MRLEVSQTWNSPIIPRRPLPNPIPREASAIAAYVTCLTDYHLEAAPLQASLTDSPRISQPSFPLAAPPARQGALPVCDSPAPASGSPRPGSGSAPPASAPHSAAWARATDTSPN